MSYAYAAARASLRKKLPGIDNQIGRAVAEMADYYDKPSVRVWSDIRPIMRDGLSIASGWTVVIYAQIPGMSQITMPVIPDEYNTRPGKVIKAGDKPYEFMSMIEAERAAEDAVTSMRKQIKDELGA